MVVDAKRTWSFSGMTFLLTEKDFLLFSSKTVIFVDFALGGLSSSSDSSNIEVITLCCRLRGMMEFQRSKGDVCVCLVKRKCVKMWLHAKDRRRIDESYLNRFQCKASKVQPRYSL